MARTRAPLPAFPDEVPLPATFGDWYDLAAVNLGIAERRDSGASRLLAGLVLVLLCTLGLGVFAGPQVVAVTGAGSPDVATLVLGVLLAGGALVWWFRFRRDWRRARALRRAWSSALRDQQVLRLPAREAPASGPDPEEQSDYRAREHATLAPYPGVRSVDGVTGFLDFLRAVFYPVAFGAGLLVVVVGLSQDAPADRVAPVLSALPLAVASLCAGVRAWLRLGDSWRLVGLQHDDRCRWVGWRVLHGLDRPLELGTGAARRALLLLPVVLGAVVVVLARAGTGTFGAADVLVGAAIVVVPALAVWGSFVLRAAAARRGGDGLRVEVLPDGVPPLGPTVAPRGAARLTLQSGQAMLRGAQGGFEAEATALISGAVQMLATRRHFLVLADGSQVRLTCADTRSLQARAADAGVRVL